MDYLLAPTTLLSKKSDVNVYVDLETTYYLGVWTVNILSCFCGRAKLARLSYQGKACSARPNEAQGLLETKHPLSFQV